VAGPALTPEQQRLATVGGDEVLRANEAANRKLRTGTKPIGHRVIVPPINQIGPKDMPINLMGRFPNAKVVELRPAPAFANVVEVLPASEAV
jgi:hypothetical protein